MSGRYYEELWREGVADLVGLLDAEHPEDRAVAPKKHDDWARLYVRYVQTFRKLCTAHDGLAHPQKRAALRRTLESCLGRVLELCNWLATLSSGVDVLELGDQLAALQLAPEVLDLPVPAYFREARAEALAARAAAAAEAALVIVGAEGAVGGEVAAAAAAEATDVAAAAAADDAPDATGIAAAGPGGSDTDSAQPLAPPAGEREEQAGANSEPLAASTSSPARADEAQQPEPAPATAQGHAPNAPVQGELGAAAAAAAFEAAAAAQDEEGQHVRTAAATKVQAGVRGWRARRLLASQRQQELEFLGMLPPSDGKRSTDLEQRLAAVGTRRKQLQVERQAELEGAMLSIKAAVKQKEGWAMKEGVRDKLNDWFLKSRDPESGQYADLPVAAKGGSRNIIAPPPPQPTPEEAAAAAAAASKASASASKSSGKGAAAGVPRVSTAFVEGLQEAVQQYMDVWQEYEEVDPTLVLLPPQLRGLPQPKNNTESYDADMITAEVRPVVFEEVRLEADDEMRQVIANIKDMLRADREGRRKKGGKKGAKEGGKKAGGKKEGGKKGEKDGKGGKKEGKGGAGGAEGEAPAKKKRKDLTAGRSIESLFAELASAGLVRSPAVASLDDFLGGERLAQVADLPNAPQLAPALKPKTGGKKANAAAKPPPAGKGGKDKGAGGAGAAGAEEEKRSYPEPSLAQARQAVAAACVLPLGAHDALAKLQAPHTVLLYGPHGSGKSLLAQAVAHQAGATMFDLTPSATDGQYAGKAAALMVHMVFKAARALAPSVVLIEDADTVFVTDKTRARALAGAGGEPPNRIKKQLLAEVADLDPGCGVLVILTSSQPQACVKKDERALRTCVQRYIQLPLPDYGGRFTLLRSFAKREALDVDASLSLLCQLTAGLSAGQLLAFVQRLAAAHREALAACAAARARPPSTTAVTWQDPPGASGGQQAGAGSVHAASGIGIQQQGQQRREQGQGQLVRHKQRHHRPVPPAVEELALQLLPDFVPLSREAGEALQEWSARVHSPLPPEEEPKKGDKKGTKKK